MSLNICAVVVTFNRKELLIETLTSICNQKIPVEKVYIIDNASTDGTHDFLYERQFASRTILSRDESITAYCPTDVHATKVQYIRLDKNSGGAGGFSLGQELSFSEGFEWIWMMDDDGFPSPNCLAELITANASCGFLALNPLVIDKDDLSRLSFGLPNIESVGKARKEADKNFLLHGVANPFNGTLVHRDVVKKIGLIKREMFIWGDESEYFLRMTSAKINFATVTNADFFHPKSKSKTKSVCGLFSVEVKPEHLEMNFIRNIGFIDRTYNNRIAYILLAKYSIMFLVEMRFKRLIMTLRYYFDGWLNSYKLPPVV